MIGQTISHYRIVEKLGEGGMGVVYKAEDVKLGRAVALKFLPSHLIESQEHKARFLHEARAAALLDHPNICTVYEIDEADGQTFLAMACLGGQTLKQKIAARPLPLQEALDIAIQIGQGLQAAHEKGIVHRDIKPANIMITPQGQVKIMDFGLAQLSDRTKLTATGSKLGTPAYMSPEQTEGKPADRRSDIWALGVVLYEMISGRVPFPGEAEAAVAYAIVHTQPQPLTALRSGLPIDLDRIAAKALAKDPGSRYQHVDDLLVDLRKWDTPKTSSSRHRVHEPNTKPRGKIADSSVLGRPVSRITALAIAAVAAAATGFLVWTFAPRPPDLRSKHLTLNLPTGHVLHEVGVPFALSRDGSKLAYVEGSFEVSNVVLKSLDSQDVTLIQGTWPAIGVAFSHDGKWIAFKSHGVLKKVPVGGGAVVSLCDTDEASQENGMSWTPDGIFFSAGVSGSRGIARVSAEGGAPEPVTAVQAGEVGHLWPQGLPGGRTVLFTILASRQPMTTQAAVQSLATGERKVVLENASAARYVSSGHLVYARGSDVYAVAFNLQRLETVGSPVLLIQGLGSRGGAPQFAIADDGTFLYDSAVPSARLSLVWADRKGVSVPLAAPAHAYHFPTISPDGQRLAVLRSEGERRDVWVYRLGGELNRLTYDGTATNAIWTPDGTALTFNGRDGERLAMFRQGMRSGDLPSRLFTASGASRGPWPGSWTPDGSALIFMQDSDGPTRGDLFSFLPGADGQTQPFLQTEFLEWGGRISPDGRWMAYISNDSGRFEVYVRPYPGAGNRVQVSVEGGTEVVWARNGRELFYRNQHKLIAAQIQTEPTLELGKRTELFEAPFARGVPGIPNYDVSPDGTRFLMLKPSDEKGEGRSLNIIVNWFEELERRVAVGQK